MEKNQHDLKLNFYVTKSKEGNIKEKQTHLLFCITWKNVYEYKESIVKTITRLTTLMDNPLYYTAPWRFFLF